MLTQLEKRIIASIQQDIPICSRPYQEIAGKLGISEDTFLWHLEDLAERGIIRRFGATLRHQKSGFEANAMVAWMVEPERIDQVGQTLAQFPQVSHCYHRIPGSDWPYTLYTMVHARDEASCRETARLMAETVNLDTYLLLFSQRELKKTSMQYFAP